MLTLLVSHYPLPTLRLDPWQRGYFFLTLLRKYPQFVDQHQQSPPRTPRLLSDRCRWVGKSIKSSKALRSASLPSRCYAISSLSLLPRFHTRHPSALENFLSQITTWVPIPPKKPVTSPCSETPHKHNRCMKRTTESFRIEKHFTRNFGRLK